MVQQLATYIADQALHKWMRRWYERHRLDLVNTKDSQVGFPSMEEEQWVSVGAEMFGKGRHALEGIAEHAAKRYTAADVRLRGRTNNTARALIHYDHHPM